MVKAILRKNIKEKLKALAKEDKLTFSNAIYNKLIGHIALKNVKAVFIYNSFADEPDTKEIIEYFLANKIDVYIPKINGDVMSVCKIDKTTKYKTNKYGIAEPINAKNLCDTEIIDINIIPLVAFDSHCNRLGRGKGYYDKYLSMSDAINIGLAYECQKVESVPIEVHDMPLDYVISEKQIYKKR